MIVAHDCRYGRAQRTPWFGQDDCGKVLAAVKQAGEYIAGLTAEAATGE